MNNIAQALQQCLTETVKMTIKSWTSDWCKSADCMKWQCHRTEVYSWWVMWIFWHWITIHSVIHVHSEWCCEACNLDNWKFCVSNDKEVRTFNRVLNRDSANWRLSSQLHWNQFYDWQQIHNLRESVHWSQTVHWSSSYLRMQMLFLC